MVKPLLHKKFKNNDHTIIKNILRIIDITLKFEKALIIK
jgi:hypothetical protein